MSDQETLHTAVAAAQKAAAQAQEDLRRLIESLSQAEQREGKLQYQLQEANAEASLAQSRSVELEESSRALQDELKAAQHQWEAAESENCHLKVNFLWP